MATLFFDKDFLRKLEQIALIVKRIKPGSSQGLRRSPKKGSSVEFADFRNYTKGDDLRRVDWNAYARLDRLFLKLFVEEQDTTLYTLIDRSRSMTFGDGAKYLFGIKAAAALSYLAVMGYDRASVGFLSDRLDDMLLPTFGQSAWMAIWDYLSKHAGYTEVRTTAFDRAIKDFCMRKPSPGISVLISDLFAHDYQSGIKSLQAASQDVVVVHVLSPDEISPEAFGEVRLIDSETQQVREVSLTPQMIRDYRARTDEFCESARRFCASRGASYIRVTSDEPVDQFVLHGLTSLGLLH